MHFTKSLSKRGVRENNEETPERTYRKSCQRRCREFFRLCEIFTGKGITEEDPEILIGLFE